MQLITYDQVKAKIIEIRDQQVILDSDVAELYGVETKRINEAVKNNPGKFPEGFLIELSPDEWEALKSKISTSKLKAGRRRPENIFPNMFLSESIMLFIKKTA